jgi:DNA transformation protein
MMAAGAPMDRDFLADLFAPFGAVTIRRMFSGFGISADGVNFALVIRGALYLRADAETIARFEAEGMAPFAYTTRLRTVTVGSYWRLPERLLDDPDELAEWARAALRAAERAALTKPRRKPRPAEAGTAKPAKKAARATAKANKQRSSGK